MDAIDPAAGPAATPASEPLTAPSAEPPAGPLTGPAPRLAGMIRDVPVTGGTLRVQSLGTGPRHAIAVHGITGNGSCWQPLARALSPEWTLHAVDLRGRGHSAALPGPYGFARHAADLSDVATALGLDRPLLVGHSLGAYVVLLTADASPGQFDRILLVDGGLPMPVPAGADLDQLLTATLGPAITRLSQTFPSADAYVEFWQAHPALGPFWNADIERYVRYDLTGEPGALHSRVVPECARQDGRDLLAAAGQVGSALRRRAGAIRMLRAPSGMFGQPPGLMPEELVAHWQDQLPGLEVTTTPDTNHYTILFEPAATERIAAAMAHAAGYDVDQRGS